MHHTTTNKELKRLWGYVSSHISSYVITDLFTLEYLLDDALLDEEVVPALLGRLELLFEL